MEINDKDQLLENLNQLLAGGMVPHNAALGLRAIDLGPDSATVRLPYDEKLVGNPETGVLHGGAVTTLLDGTCGLAIFMKMPVPNRIATIDFRIDYLRSAEPGRDVLCRAECYHLTKSVAFARAVAFHEGPELSIASAVGTFMIFHDETSITGLELGRQ